MKISSLLLGKGTCLNHQSLLYISDARKHRNCFYRRSCPWKSVPRWNLPVSRKWEQFPRNFSKQTGERYSAEVPKKTVVLPMVAIYVCWQAKIASQNRQAGMQAGRQAGGWDDRRESSTIDGRVLILVASLRCEKYFYFVGSRFAVATAAIQHVSSTIPRFYARPSANLVKTLLLHISTSPNARFTNCKVYVVCMPGKPAYPVLAVCPQISLVNNAASPRGNPAASAAPFSQQQQCEKGAGTAATAGTGTNSTILKVSTGGDSGGGGGGERGGWRRLALCCSHHMIVRQTLRARFGFSSERSLNAYTRFSENKNNMCNLTTVPTAKPIDMARPGARAAARSQKTTAGASTSPAIRISSTDGAGANCNSGGGSGLPHHGQRRRKPPARFPPRVGSATKFATTSAPGGDNRRWRWRGNPWGAPASRGWGWGRRGWGRSSRRWCRARRARKPGAVWQCGAPAESREGEMPAKWPRRQQQRLKREHLAKPLHHWYWQKNLQQRWVMPTYATTNTWFTWAVGCAKSFGSCEPGRRSVFVCLTTDRVVYAGPRSLPWLLQQYQPDLEASYRRNE